MVAPGFPAEDVESIINILLVALSIIADSWQTDGSGQIFTLVFMCSPSWCFSLMRNRFLGMVITAQR